MGACVSRELMVDEKEYEKSLGRRSIVRTSSSCFNPGDSLLTLFGHDHCLDTARIRIALHHKGVGAELVWISSECSKSNNGQTLLSALMGGKLPLLQHEDTTICSSTQEILSYIDKRFPYPPLAHGRAMHEDALQSWVGYIRDDLTTVILLALSEGNSHIKQDLASKLDAAFGKLDSAIAEHGGEGPFFMGKYFSLVDVYAIPTLELVPALTYFCGITLNPTRYYLAAYIKRIRSFPSYFPVKAEIIHVQMALCRTIAEKPQPAILCMTILQHRSITRHLQQCIDVAVELSSISQGPKVLDPVKGTLGMQVKKFGKAYSRLLEVMQEHAQMEERIVFPPLEDADKGVTKVVIAHHARDLPAMNGIREDIKTLTAIAKGTPDFDGTLNGLILRLRAFQVSTAKHFQEEEQTLLPMLPAVDIGNKRQEALVISCVEVMEATHGHLLPFFLLGLQPHEMYQYMLMMQKCSKDGKLFTLMMQTVRNADDEFEIVRREVGRRMLPISKV